MKTIGTLCIVAALTMGNSAFAAERALGPEHQMDGANRLLEQQRQIFRHAVGADRHAPDKPQSGCTTIDVLEAGLHGAKFTPLNIGQFHYVLGAFDAFTPDGTPLPNADNALLVSGNEHSIVVWMKENCLAPTNPMPVSNEFVGHLLAIHPTAGETSDAPDTSEDMHL